MTVKNNNIKEYIKANYKKISILLWGIIILTTAFIAAAGVISLFLPEKEYLVFGKILMSLKIAPVWLRLMITSIGLQAVVTTVLIAVDLEEKKHRARDIAVTTVIGIVCIVLVLLPFISGFQSAIVRKSGYKAEYFTFGHDNHEIVIEERTYMNNSFGDVYIKDDDGSLRLIGMFDIDGGIRNNGNYELEWFPDKVSVTYEKSHGKTEKVNCFFKTDIK